MDYSAVAGKFGLVCCTASAIARVVPPPRSAGKLSASGVNKSSRYLLQGFHVIVVKNSHLVLAYIMFQYDCKCCE